MTWPLVEDFFAAFQSKQFTLYCNEHKTFLNETGRGSRKQVLPLMARPLSGERGGGKGWVIKEKNTFLNDLAISGGFFCGFPYPFTSKS